ncbi:FMN-linked oxidoreductase [Xylariaceae sp. AK1471]|nr:FMN-linked oxidoreductase [Xylariaceae sp. AK1471]
MEGHIPPRLYIEPPLFNSANPWATTLEHLRSLYTCSATGAVTTRTALINEGFPHDEGLHQFAFFETATHRLLSPAKDGENGKDGDASLNNLGYSPIPLDGYLGFIRRIDEETRGAERIRKPFIISVTGTPDEVAECYRRIARCRFGGAGKEGGEGGSERMRGVCMPLAMEVNLSCPNIPGKPPPAYEGEALKSYIRRISEMVLEVAKEVGAEEEEDVLQDFRIPWGVKTPPYTHAGQFEMFVSALRDCAVSISFVTATNTLGSCLLLDDGVSPALPRLGIGGMAGAPLHPLALGNVATLRRLLDATPETKHVALLGIGGVGDAEAYKRMRSVGAAAVGVGTALGIKGLGVFEEIERGLGGVWDVKEKNL